MACCCRTVHHHSADWRISSLGWMYTLVLRAGLLGCAVGRLAEAPPRKAGVVSALCWVRRPGDLGTGVYTHQLWLLAVGDWRHWPGLGYISPVSTLIKWFPDRRGMGTGHAIMGLAAAP